jgi:hypothetical protein
MRAAGPVRMARVKMARVNRVPARTVPVRAGSARRAAARVGHVRVAACEDGACHKRHVGRYGGLAKHHLSPEEEAALQASDYGATGPAGPPTGAVAYPYYTTRGPRDFLAKCPPSIGP